MENDEHAGFSLVCAGILAGVITLPSSQSTVGDLRREILQRLGERQALVNLIVQGRCLKADERTLAQCGVRENAKVLVLAGSGGALAQSVDRQSEKAARLDRLKTAVSAMASRSDYSDGVRSFEIENQAGLGLHLSKEDRKAVGMGLAMHLKGQHSLKQGRIGEALQELLLAEEAFELAPSKLLDGVDNIALLMLDIVWCFFLLQDATKLGAAKGRLEKAQAGLQQSHGKDLCRLRVLHGNFRPELATYVRFEMLLGAVEFYAGNKEGAKKWLLTAQQKLRQLQVSDKALAAVLGMGFTVQEATRSLRFCEGDVGQAAEFAVEQQNVQKRKRDEEKADKAARKEQRGFGRTQSGERVNIKTLSQLQSMFGFERALLAEALKQVDNNGDAALDLLTHPDSLEKLQCRLSAHRCDRQASIPVGEAKQQLLDLGFSDQDVASALESFEDECSIDAATAVLLGESSSSPQDFLAAGHRAPKAEEKMDHETEDSIAESIHSDPLAAYDVDVTREGAAIEEFLAKLA